MKWFLVSMMLWGDGAYAFYPLPSPGTAKGYDSEGECLADIKIHSGRGIPGQPTRYSGYVCVPAEAWEKFTKRRTPYR
jgi:hypothetical protein